MQTCSLCNRTLRKKLIEDLAGCVHRYVMACPSCNGEVGRTWTERPVLKGGVITFSRDDDGDMPLTLTLSRLTSSDNYRRLVACAVPAVALAAASIAVIMVELNRHTPRLIAALRQVLI